MTYNSLFDIAKSRDPHFFDFTDQKRMKQEFHRYEGRLGDVIDSVAGRLFFLLHSTTEGSTAEDIGKLLLGTGRIIRGILDYKSSKLGDEKDYPGIIQKALDVCFSIYSLREDSLEKLSKLRSEIDDMLFEEVTQRDDSESWVAMDPYFSKKTAQKLSKEIGREDYVFVALGHGGVVPGIDVFLRLQQQTEKRGEAYPIRFSMTKHKDKKPMLRIDGEKDFFHNIIQGKIVVLFDEDSSSGNTLKYAREYLQSDFSGYTKALQVSNLGKGDYRTDTFVI